eukprot:4359122-Amphidinium_carterae.1
MASVANPSTLDRYASEFLTRVSNYPGRHGSWATRPNQGADWNSGRLNVGSVRRSMRLTQMHLRIVQRCLGRVSSKLLPQLQNIGGHSTMNQRLRQRWPPG